MVIKCARGSYWDVVWSYEMAFWSYKRRRGSYFVRVGHTVLAFWDVKKRVPCVSGVPPVPCVPPFHGGTWNTSSVHTSKKKLSFFPICARIALEILEIGQ